MLNHSPKVRLAHAKAHTIITARASREDNGVGLQGLQLHQQAERQSVPRETLNERGTQLGGKPQGPPRVHRADG